MLQLASGRKQQLRLSVMLAIKTVSFITVSLQVITIPSGYPASRNEVIRKC